jgi:hypothetical protein
MCLYIFPPPTTHRYDTAITGRSAKRTFTHQDTTTREWHEPLRGYGIRRDPLNSSREDRPSAGTTPAVLRGYGVKRSAPRLQVDPTIRLPVPVEYARAQASHGRVRLREPPSRYRESHRAERGLPALDGRYSRRFRPIDRDVFAGNPSYNYHMPESCYIDICALRTATNRALQVTIPELVRPLPKSHRLRRQPAYSQLQLRYRSS